MAKIKRDASPEWRESIVAARSLLQRSHLAPTSAADSFVEFEFALHHITEAFARWSSALDEYVSGELLPAQAIAEGQPPKQWTQCPLIPIAGAYRWARDRSR